MPEKKKQDDNAEVEGAVVAANEGPQFRTVTVAGVKFDILEDALDDWELMEDLAEVDDGAIMRAPKVLERLLGDQKDKAMDAIRDKKTGRVSMEAGATFFKDLLAEVNPNS